MNTNKQSNNIKVLFNYYVTHGFEQNLEDTAHALGISKKTFYNRYHNKNEAIKMAVLYWHQVTKERFEHYDLACNHDVESLVLFINEVFWIKGNETPFYDYTLEHGGFDSSDTPFPTILENILKKGIQHYQFKKDIQPEIYSHFLIHNLTAFCPIVSHKDIIVQYLLAPLLNERGQEVFQELNLSFLLH